MKRIFDINGRDTGVNRILFGGDPETRIAG